MKVFLNYLFEAACDNSAESIFDKYGFVAGSYSYGALMIFIYDVLREFSSYVHSDDFVENIFDTCAEYCGFNVEDIPDEFYDAFYSFIELTGFVERDKSE